MTDPTAAPEQLQARPWQQSAAYALAAVALLLGGSWLYARSQSAYPFFGTAYGNTPTVTPFKGTDQNAQPWALKTGKTTAIFFGFTHCPNICPLSLSYLNKVWAQLPPDQQKEFEVLLVSVDPARDTPQRLKEYVDYFGRGTGVRVPEPELTAVAQQFNVAYRKSAIRSDTEYQIDHTTATYLIDRTGHLRVLWDYTQLPQVERVKADVQYVLEHPLP